MRRTIIIISFFLSLKLAGQAPALSDTIRIREVVISSKQRSEFFPGSKTDKIDSLTVFSSSGKDLGSLLTFASTLHIKSYGPGGIATPSFRGTSASHTQISWNGINITNPMLGQSDLSLIPAEISDKILIHYGSSAPGLMNPGIGGSINMVSKPDWRPGSEFSITGRGGSFGSYTGILKFLTGNSGFQSATKLYFNSSENDFPFLNKYLGNGPEIHYRTNSNIEIKGLLQEVYLKRKSFTVSGKTWYQSAFRNLPQPVIALSNNSEYQKDESLRTILDIRSDKGANEFFITAAGLFSGLNYQNRDAGIDSRNSTSNLIFRSGLLLHHISFSNIRIAVENDLGSVNSNNYSKVVRRNISTILLMAESKSGKYLNYSLQLREKIDGLQLFAPDFSAGTAIRLIPGSDYFINASFARNSRLPSLNELYWNPGGNPNLKNEEAYEYEIGYDVSHSFSKGINVTSGTNLFYYDIKDMIHWHPGSSTYWIPENLKSINSYGLESDMKVDYKGFNSEIEMKFSYSFTRSVQTNPNSSDLTGKQLLYVPVNQVAGYLNYSLGHFNSMIQATYSGKRYLTSDNSTWLPGYSVINILTGYKFRIGTGIGALNFRIDNILDSYYEAIAFYPQPGRSFHIAVTYTHSNR